jgi:phosphopentomutase
MTYKRIFLIVIDSFGMGAMADAKAFGDEGVDTLGHISESVPKLYLPNLCRLGLGEIHPFVQQMPSGKAGRAALLNEKSRGKDTMTGHWEMMGLETTKPFQTFTETGFPKELIEALEKETGHKVIGNKSASGTEILDELAETEIATGNMIVYTSADSVLQICGNEETFGLEELYRCCEIARKLTMKEAWKVGRVIARPYVGKKKGEFVRTANRHDYALKPFDTTVLDVLKQNHLDVISIGKIRDIFDGEGITQSEKSNSSVHGMEQTVEWADKEFTGLCFVNLVDFDAKWGHRRNPEGYGKELEAFDEKLGQLLEKLKEDDLLIVTADHGNDPTFKGTDHTREKVPFLAWSKQMNDFKVLPEQSTFGIIGATIADNFGVPFPKHGAGESLLDELASKV